MLSVPASLKIYLARDPVDFRKSFDGLCSIVRDGFGKDPFLGDIFVFFNKRRDRVKLLHWDQNGFWLFYKRLEKGTFDRYITFVDDEGCAVADRATLYLILEGIELRTSRHKRNFARSVSISRQGTHDTTREASRRSRVS